MRIVRYILSGIGCLAILACLVLGIGFAIPSFRNMIIGSIGGVPKSQYIEQIEQNASLKLELEKCKASINEMNKTKAELESTITSLNENAEENAEIIKQKENELALLNQRIKNKEEEMRQIQYALNNVSVVYVSDVHELNFRRYVDDGGFYLDSIWILDNDENILNSVDLAREVQDYLKRFEIMQGYMEDDHYDYVSYTKRKRYNVSIDGITMGFDGSGEYHSITADTNIETEILFNGETKSKDDMINALSPIKNYQFKRNVESITDDYGTITNIKMILTITELEW